MLGPRIDHALQSPAVQRAVEDAIAFRGERVGLDFALALEHLSLVLEHEGEHSLVFGPGLPLGLGRGRLASQPGSIRGIPLGAALCNQGWRSDRVFSAFGDRSLVAAEDWGAISFMRCS